MKTATRLLSLVILSFIFLVPAPAQKIDVGRKIKNKAVNRVDRRTDQAIDKGLDAVEDGVRDAVSGDSENSDADSNAKGKASAGQQPAQQQSSDSQDAASQAVVAEKPPLSSYSKFDFIPGERVIFFEDFSQDAVGDFPALWYTNGSGEVVTLNNYPGHWLMMREKSDYACLFPEEMPDNYTIEFDYIRQECRMNMNGTVFYFFSVPKDKSPFDRGDYPGFRMEVLQEKAIALNNAGTEAIEKVSNRRETDLLEQKCGQAIRVSIWVQKQRVRIYFDQEKVFDIPRLLPKDKKVNTFRINKRLADRKDFISNVRIAVGAPDMRNKLLTEGRLVTYGITFDTGSDKVRPESYGVLKEISTVLSENPGMRIKIVGHTDSDGDAGSNMELSKRRAQVVKNELTTTFGIDGSRIDTDGKGETETVAPNDTPANKALNRRVEFIKL